MREMNDKVIYLTDNDVDYTKVDVYTRDDRGILQKDEIYWTRKVLPGFIPLSWDYYFYNKCEPDLDNWRLLYYDIECDDTDPSLNFNNKRILCICFIDDKNRRWVVTDDDEEKILRKTEVLFKNYDAVIGFNSENFDFPLLIERGRRYGIDFEQYDWKSGDMYKIFKKFNNINIILSSSSLRSWSLGSLGEAFLGKKKLESRSGAGHLLNIFKTDRKRLTDYCMMDVEITKELGEKFDVMETVKTMSKLSNCPPNLIFYTMNFCTEFLIVKYCLMEPQERQRKIFRVLEKNYNKPGEEYEGALNYIKSPGYYKEVAVLDFHSLYPSLIRTFNFSPETMSELNEDFIKHIGDKSLLDKLALQPRGIVPKISDFLQVERDKYKKAGEKTKEVSIKLINNSIYGYFGSKTGKFKDVQVAGGITGMARLILASVAKQFDAVYGDTDSAFLICPYDKVDKLRKDVNDYVYSLFKDIPNMDKSFVLEMDLDKYFKKLILIEKKKYIGLKSDDKQYGKGIELVKSDYTAFGKKIMQEMVNRILFNDAGISEITKYLMEQKINLLDGKVPNVELLMTQTLSKLPGDYASVPIHVQIANARTKRGQTAYIGQKITYLITGKKNGKITGVDEENMDGAKPDYYYYWKHKIIKSINKVLITVYGNDEGAKLLFMNLESNSKMIQRGLVK
jgi:DNA polymerase elongation subunit (family B)